MGVCDCTKKCLEESSSDPATTNHVTSNVVKVTIKDQQDDPQQQESFIVEGHPAFEGQNRIQWSSPVEFLLTCIGYSVGLGNVWRFPYLCYKNGGGAFLIPYSLMMLFIGMPLLFMEYSFGQYFGIGSLSIFKQVCPLFQGVGIGYSILNGLVGIYYNVIIAISIYFLFGSFSPVLPWSHCNNTWNTENCETTPSYDGGGDDFNSTMFTYNSTASVTTLLLPPMTTPSSSSSPFSVTSDLLKATLLLANRSKHLNSSHPKSSPSDEFFRLSLMGETDDNSIANLGHVQWALCLCLLLSWILVAMFVSQGIKSSGKVAYFTATFPYVMLTILVARGVTLNGATDGLLYFIDPVWDKLMSPDVWFQAATQLFYSLNLAWGGMITMSSYNLHNHNCFRDAIVINCVSFGTSLYAGVAVFSIIGYMAKESGIPIPQVIKSGPGLAFIAYPRALSLMPFPQLWSVLFFVMLFLLGIGSQMVCVETIMTGIMDTWRFLVVKWQYRVTAIAIVCSLGFFLGIPCTTQGGMYVLQLMDHYSAGFCVLIIAIVECVVINWIYGDSKMAGHVKYMLGKDMNPVFRICWKYISPTLILVILLFSFVRYTPVVYAGKTYPIWADVIGWMMTLASNIPIVVVAVYMLCTAKGTTLRQRFQAAIQPQVDEESSERRHRESVYLNSKRDDVTLGCDANSDVMIGCDVNNDVRLHQCEMKLQSSDDVAINGEPL